MRFKIAKALLDKLDDEILVQDLATPIGGKARPPTGKKWTVYSANPHLTRAQISVALIADIIVEVLNGGVFQLVMNPTGGFLPDMPSALRDLGRKREAKIIEDVLSLFPDEATVRDYDARLEFISTRIVPGGWDGLLAAKKRPAYKKLVRGEEELVELLQSRGFFKAVADFVQSNPDSFVVTKR